MFWSLERAESFTQYFPFRHHKKRQPFFFHSKHRDLHLNKVVAIETVNYTFSRARLCLTVEDYVTANIIHIGDIVPLRINAKCSYKLVVIMNYT
jgi:hypothetical protein